MEVKEESIVKILTSYFVRQTNEIVEEGQVVSINIEENVEIVKYVFINDKELELTENEDEASLFLQSHAHEIERMAEKKFGYKRWYLVFEDEPIIFLTNESIDEEYIFGIE